MFFKPKKVVAKDSPEAKNTPPALQTKIGVFPGTFDPITKGHVDLIERSLMLVHDLIIAVADDSSTSKSPIFSVEKRIEMVKADIAHLDQSRIKVLSFDSLLVDFARKHGVCRIIRGIRRGSDLEYELQMAYMNRRLAPEVATVFLPSSEETLYISSTLVKDIAKHDGDISPFVSNNVRRELMAYFHSSVNRG